MPETQERVEVKVLVSDQYRTRLPEIVHNLQTAGMEVKQQLEALGVVTGSIDPSGLEALSHLNGVAQVSPERHYQLAPPNSDVQ